MCGEKRSSFMRCLRAASSTTSATQALRSGRKLALSRDNLASLKKQLSSFSQTFTENDFKTVYDTRYTLDSEVLEYVSVDALKNLDSVVEEMGVNFVQVRADQSGIVSYMVDSLEGVDPNQVTEEMFDRSGYTKNILKSGTGPWSSR